MKILAVIVTYNRIKLLKECILALKNQTYTNFDTLVIDNASTDGTAKYLKDSELLNIRMNKNTGGAGGFYQGIKESVLLGYDYVWVMDDDTIPMEDCLSSLLKTVEQIKENFGFLCSYVQWINKEPCVMNIPTPSLIKSSKDVYLLKQGIEKVESASFVSILFPIKIIKKYGLPIKEFFIWGDDVEYTQRISKYENCYCDFNSIVIHKMNNNNPTDIITDIPERIDRYKFAFRNRCFIARQNGIKGIIMNNFSVLYQILKLLKSKTNNKIRRLNVIISSWIRGQFFRPRIDFL